MDKTLLCAALLAAFPLAPCAATPPAADTVPINGVAKPASGKLVSATVGDTACYLDFENTAGDRFSELAEFELCEQTGLTGQWLQLGYTTGWVLADSCQGDPKCKDRKQVILLSSLNVADAATGPLEDASDSSAETPPDCKAGESAVFHCKTAGGKHVSVCVASTDGESPVTALAYRFGKIGAAPELQLVQDPRGAKAPVYGRTVMLYGGGGAWIRFTRGDHAYVMYSGIARWGGRDHLPADKDGVVVERKGQQIANLPCTEPLLNELSPALFKRIGSDPAREDDFQFPD